jgi:serine/threonine protein phosphatase PrpC
VEIVLSDTFAGVTNRGRRHERNEDDLALGQPPAVPVLIVCDGVSSSNDAQRASAVAAETVRERLEQAVPLGAADAEETMRGAIDAANAAVCALTPAAHSTEADPPETTVVAALVRDGVAVIGWVGDSRAYWIDREQPAASLLLTHDHSWMNDMVDSGQMSEAEAQLDRRAHAITRCLGPSDDPEGSTPSVTVLPLPERRGFLLLCSDGLWNYAPDAAQIAALVREAPEDAVGIARSLVAWANAQGGRDNITVALLAVAAATLEV